MQHESADKNETVDWDTMMDAAQSSPDGLRLLVERQKCTTSPQVASQLIGVIAYCQSNGPATHDEATIALIELVKNMKVWEMTHSQPLGLLAALHSAIYEYGLPEGADYGALAEFIRQASSRDESTFKGHLFSLDVEVINLCAGLAARGQLASVLATHPEAREEMILKLELIMGRLAQDHPDLYKLYGADGNFALQYLRSRANEKGDI